MSNESLPILINEKVIGSVVQGESFYSSVEINKSFNDLDLAIPVNIRFGNTEINNVQIVEMSVGCFSEKERNMFVFDEINKEKVRYFKIKYFCSGFRTTIILGNNGETD